MSAAMERAVNYAFYCSADEKCIQGAVWSECCWECKEHVDAYIGNCAFIRSICKQFGVEPVIFIQHLRKTAMFRKV